MQQPQSLAISVVDAFSKHSKNQLQICHMVSQVLSWSVKVFKLYTTFVVVGGALELSEYLPGYLKDYQLEFSLGPIYANARGYFKVAKSLLEIT